MQTLFTLENFITFVSLSGLEIILGIDNIIFIAIAIYNIPQPRRARIGFLGVSLAIILRIIMLSGVSWIMTLIKPLFFLSSMEFTGRSILLLLGGGFLLMKASIELLEMLRGKDHSGSNKK